MIYSQKYALAHFLTPLADGMQFHMTEWPLHTTLVDVFMIDRATTNIDAKLAAVLSEIEPVTVGAKDDIVLGMTPVVLLEKTLPLEQLHLAIVDLLEENGAIFNNTQFARDGFLPHSTIQDNGRLSRGDVITIDSLSLVDMFPGGDWEQRKVLATFTLG